MLSDSELWEWAVEEGLSIDMGYAAGGPFVPDGTVRIYDSVDSQLLAEGADLREAIQNYQLTFGC